MACLLLPGTPRSPARIVLGVADGTSISCTRTHARAVAVAGPCSRAEHTVAGGRASRARDLRLCSLQDDYRATACKTCPANTMTYTGISNGTSISDCLCVPPPRAAMHVHPQHPCGDASASAQSTRSCNIDEHPRNVAGSNAFRVRADAQTCSSCRHRHRSYAAQRIHRPLAPRAGCPIFCALSFSDAP